MTIRIAFLIIILTLLASCKQTPTSPYKQVADSSPTAVQTSGPPVSTVPATHTPTAPPTVTASATAVPPTPTATAPPATIISANLRQMSLNDPSPQTGAPCGVVDTLDFPLDPPNASNIARGGQDFGVYRERYNGYHAGEDWGIGGSSLGAPVYSIGHGTVTYAAPLGWGADQGVLIVRHVYPDGSTVLSFYGHLEPTSIVLKAGECIARGEQVGTIGKPRTPPHLHFEIRTHMPAAPGPGYWSSDPALAGWKPPSQYIWNYRISSSPGVSWTRPSNNQGVQGIGMLDADTFVVYQDESLVGVSLTDGSLHWSQPISTRVTSALINTQQSTIYLTNLLGNIQALSPSDEPSSDAALTPLWEAKIDAIGSAALLPLPNGGLLASFREQTLALSSDGELLWSQDANTRAFDWALCNDHLIFSTVGETSSIWSVTETEFTPWGLPLGGRLATAHDRVWLYAESGIYRLNPDRLDAELVYALPKGLMRWGDIIALPAGGALVVHTDAFDRRLIALNVDGRLRWERSCTNMITGYQQDLLLVNGQPYLATHKTASSSSELSILAVDMETAELVQIFEAGSRNALPGDIWALVGYSERLLVNVGGTGMLALDVRAALEIIVDNADAP